MITPASRGVRELSQLLRDFRNQTFRNFEHIIVYDGKPPGDVINLMKAKGGKNTIFCSITKDMGNIRIAPGTRPRNHGVSLAQGEYVVFCDDDNRYKDTFIETHLNNMARDKAMSVVQVACSESRVYRNGDPGRIQLIPEVGLGVFPVICHVDTANCMFPRKWIVETPWLSESEHDFKLIKRVVDKYTPEVRIRYGAQADLDGLLTKGLHDWVSIPPFYRE